MIFQIHVLGEGRLAHNAFEFLVAAVRLHVDLQTSQPRVALPAVLAAEVPLSGVAGHVLFQSRRQIESFVAQLALMFEDFEMETSVVLPQGLPAVVSSVALLALEGPLLAVDVYHVPVSQAVREEHFIALAALVSRFLLVEPRYVDVSRVFGLEILPALLASEALLVLLVGFLVQHKHALFEVMRAAYIAYARPEVLRHVLLQGVEEAEAGAALRARNRTGSQSKFKELVRH